MAHNTRSTSSKPVIGVTGNDKWFSPSWWSIRLAIFMAGGQALRVSIKHPVKLSKLDALVISGGDDIHPTLYDEDVDPNVFYDVARDRLEIDAIEYAFSQSLPLLGICRGYQLTNVVAGGSLYSDIRKLRVKTKNIKLLLPKKNIRLLANTLLNKILGQPERLKVNSLHHQAVHHLGQGFKAVAFDQDKFIQAIEHDTLPMIGVQWHPEYLLFMKSQRQLFSWLVHKASDVA